MDRDGELEELLAEQPHPDVFRAVGALLDRWPRAGAEHALARAEAAMASWPLSARVAPWSWGRALAAGTRKASWRLARGLETQPPSLGKVATPWDAIAHRPELALLCRFDLVGYDGEIDAFLAHAPRWRPRWLRVRDDWQGRSAALATLPVFDHLEELHVGGLEDDTFHQPPTSLVPAIGTAPSLRAVTMRADDLVALWKRARLPVLREVSVWVLDVAQAIALAERPELSGIETLRVAFRCGHDGRSAFEPTLGHVIEASDAAANAFFARARLDALHDLTLVGRRSGYWTREGSGPESLRAAVRAGALSRLRRLRLEHLPLGDDALVELVRALPPSLRELELVDVYAKNETAVALAAQPAVHGLERLVLRANRIRSTGFAALAAAPWTRLRELDASGPDCQPYYFRVGEQPLRDEGLVAWARSGAARTLRVLSVASARLSDEALVALSECEALALERLDFGHNQATATGIEALGQARTWSTLRELSLRDCLLDDAAIEALTASQPAPRLRSLDLSYETFGGLGARSLSSWPGLAGLRRLDLHDDAIGDAGLVALAASPHVGRLLDLDLEQDCWNERAARYHGGGLALAASTAFRDLDTLRSGVVDEYHACAYTSGFTPDALDAIRRAEDLRPEVRAGMVHAALALGGEDEDLAAPASELERERRHEQDFRNRRRRIEDDADEDPEPSGPAMRQVRLDDE